MLKNKLLPCALLVLSQGLLAQQLPNAGGQMQQIPPTPIPQKAPPKVEIKPGSPLSIAESEGVRIIVNRLRVTGAQTYPESELLALTGFVPGRELSLADLRAMAARIADHYHRNGYFVAQAYLPAQDIQDGVVTVAVIEGQYGQVTLKNQTNVSNELVNGLLAGLNSGDPVTSAPLENRLLLLSDLPGVQVNSTLLPGTTLGTSDLIVDLTPGPRVSGSIDADNAGNRYTGSNRIGATVNFNEPTGHGDVATLRALTSGSGLNYLRGSYQMQLGKAKVGVAYSALRYALGQEFESLGANGTEEIASLYGSYPLVRSRNSNLYLGLAFDARTFQDKVDSASTVADKSARVLMASLMGDQRDASGQSSYALTWSAGNLELQTPAMQVLDAATAQTSGHYNKLAFSAMRLQNLSPTFSLAASINGQLASKNLDVSEKMELGGMYAVRAYPQGEAYGDEGYVLNLEARMLVPRFSERIGGQLQLIGFIDTGSVTVNNSTWAAGPNRRTLSGAGLGFNWSDGNNFMLRAYYAFKVGDEVARSAPDASGRFWIQAVKYF
ncbi:MAG: ShlB/FhaC/HecB family hemolysin secretion/activation protein [Rhodoferax sp.]|uniref:ShlB/FhaC/HecB family hemolysin secretion/activation protein n=1 Tax=Rhodoferax sp. TaxID=50421 RepID=UPI00262E3AE8|nr:ShlB/FhaC/HecB family hemolysin secretion/activation protein [Rhodoferax sp.]MDD5335185.1 ShlB/FhaC/HecB family hemolysin secretion/activation protein [Rhodoferax sp.]